MSQKYYPIIDTGHGALTKGKRSPILPDGRQLLEWQFNFNVGLELGAMLDEYEIKWGDANPTPQEVGNWLEGRVDLANDLAEAAEVYPPRMIPYFISIHANAGPGEWTTARGAETWYYRGSDAGAILAETFQHHIVRETGLKDRGVKYHETGGSFYVLRKTRMPAILTENGFFNNREELELLLDRDFIVQVAIGHLEAILAIERNGWS